MVVVATFGRYLFWGADRVVPFLFRLAGLLTLCCVGTSEADTACSERFCQEGLNTKKKTCDSKADLYLKY